MLISLYIENFALIDKASISFGDGLNVLTGETGAGKSIIIGALSLIVGEKASADYVRYTKDKAVLEAMFLPNKESLKLLIDNGYDSAEQLIINREIFASGKSSAKLNGRPITQQFLKELTSSLLDIHGQHEHQSLLNSSRQIDLLDDFVEFDKKQLQDVWHDYRQTLSELNERKKQYLHQQEQEDYYSHLHNELESANLQAGEYDVLISEKDELASFSKQSEKLNQAMKDLDSGMENVTNAFITLGKVSVEGGRLQELVQSGEELLGQMNSLQEDVSSYHQGLDFSPQRMDELTARLDTLNSLKIKHLKGALVDKDVADILLEKQTEIKKILDSIVYAQEDISVLEKRVQDLASSYTKLADELSLKRKKIGQKLAKDIESSLHELKMEKTKFVIEVTESSETANGKNKVQFMISPNIGQPLRPLAKIASGGEISRVMLAIKSVLLIKDRIPTMIFDEIDTGIGGVTAVAIADKLKETSRDHRVIVVTHLPQIAREANEHLQVRKFAVGNETNVEVKTLTKDERVAELTRMLGGGGDVVVAHAKEMLK